MQAPDATPHYRVGTASWTDPTLLSTGFYPAAVKSAEARLRFYAGHFDTVEVDSTYYALPSERNAVLWADRTPDNFRFNIKAFAWLTQHAAETRALPRPLQALLPEAARREARVREPSAEARQLAFEMFHTALAPLRDAGKLGCILLQFPPWFTARPSNLAYMAYCREQLAGDQLAVEFRHRSWVDAQWPSTEEFLATHHLALVCIDAPAAPAIAQPPYTCTTDIGYVRLHGRNRQAWFQSHGTAAQRFKYLYADAELHECAQHIQRMRGRREVYVIFNNCYADYGVRNAMTMKTLLAGINPPAGAPQP
jgi:uncharacterized protein YecE (DUF72 family)